MFSLIGACLFRNAITTFKEARLVIINHDSCHIFENRDLNLKLLGHSPSEDTFWAVASVSAIS